MQSTRRNARWKRGATLAGFAASTLALVMCSQSTFTTQRDTSNRGTVGEETFRILCERVSVSDSPRDIDFRYSRPLCTGATSASSDGGVPPDASAPGDAGSGDIPGPSEFVGPRTLAVGARRSGVVQAIDTTIPRDLYDRTDGLLLQLLPLYGSDNGRPDAGILQPDGAVVAADDMLPQTTRAMARLLDALQADNDSAAALARASHHQGYRPPQVALGFMRTMLGYPRVGDVLESTLALFREARPGHLEGAGRGTFERSLDVLRGEMSNASAAPTPDPNVGTTLDATLDFLFLTHPSLGTSKPRLLVRRDRFGMPRVRLGAGGAMPDPFVDSDSDGVADSRDGQFIGSSGPLRVASPFPANEAVDGPRDEQGRALASAGGEPMYEFVDLDQTLMAALMRDSRTLVDPGTNTAMRLARGATPLFGDTSTATHDYMLRHPCPTRSDPEAMCAVPAATFTQHGPGGVAPMLDLTHALGIALTSPNIEPVLTTVEALANNHEESLARGLAAILAIDESADGHPEATIASNSNLWDDLIDVVREIAQEPGLVEDVLSSLTNPRTQNIGRVFSEFIRKKDRIEPVWTSAATMNASLASRTLTVPVDRARPDTTDNRSILQRFTHLVSDLDGAKICNKRGARVSVSIGSITLQYPIPLPLIDNSYDECELIEIDNAALFYLKVITGTATIELKDRGLLGWAASQPLLTTPFDQIIEAQSNIIGFDTTPTVLGVNRLVFQPDAQRSRFTRDLLGPVLTRDGLDVRTLHGGTLFALETNNAYETIRPLVQAFMNHGDRGGLLFIKLLSTLHRHYASDRSGQYQSTNPRGQLFSYQTGVVKYEPIMADAFSGDLVASGSALVTALNGINAGGGRTGRDAIAALVRIIVDPNAVTGIAYRDGRTSTLRSDGTTNVPRPSLYYLLADGFNAMNDVFAREPARHDDWAFARHELVQTFLQVDGGGAPGARFRNRNIPAVMSLATGWARDRVVRHRRAGDLDGWARSMGQRLGETTSGPAFGTLLSMLDELYSDPPARAASGQLLQYLLDDSGDRADTPYGTTLTAAADLVQIVRADSDVDPLLHALAFGLQRTVTAGDGGTLREEAVPMGLRFLDRTRDYDTTRVVDELLRNVVQRPPSPLLADEPLVVMGDAIAETNRMRAGVGGPLDPDDVRAVLSTVREFLTDESRGMEQFYYIVQHRSLRR